MSRLSRTAQTLVMTLWPSGFQAHARRNAHLALSAHRRQQDRSELRQAMGF